MPDLSGDIGAAVEKAVSVQTPPATPAPSDADATGPSTAATALDSPPKAPTVRSRPERQPAAPRSTDAPTIPASATASEPESPKTGEPPKEKWESILANQRTKAVEEARSSWLTDYGIPAQADAGVIREHLEFLTRDEVGYYHALGASLRERGLLQEHGHAPGNGNGHATAPATNGRPKPSLFAENGTPAYSAADVDAIVATALSEFADTKLAPFEAMRRETEQAKLWAKLENDVKSELAEARQWDGFTELEPEIHKLMTSDKRITLRSAYHRVHTEWRKRHDAEIKTRTRQEVLNEIKAASPTNTASPTAHTPASQTKRKAHDLYGEVGNAVDRAMAESRT